MNYPISKEQKAAQIESQGGKCLVCRRTFTDALKSVVDHDHVSNEVRGVLCGGCNSGIGFFGEDPEALCAAAEYVVANRSHASAMRGFDPMRLAHSWVVLDWADAEVKRLQAALAP